MFKKLWKWILAVLGLVLFILLGKKFFSDSQDERAWKQYQKKKKKLDSERETLDVETEADQQQIVKIEENVEKINRKLAKRTAQTKEEVKNIKNMSAEEVANVTTEQERRLAERLGHNS